MYTRFGDYRNKWLKYVFVSAAKLFFDVLNETAHLSLLFESESILVYQVKNAVEEILDNLRDISNDGDYDDMPFNVKVTDNRLTGDSVNITVSAMNANLKGIRSMQEMNEEERIEAEKNVTIHKDTFTFNDLKSGRKRIQVLRKKFISKIIENEEKRFENLDDFKVLNLFNVSLWNNLNEDDVELMKLDSTKLDELAVIMKTSRYAHI